METHLFLGNASVVQSHDADARLLYTGGLFLLVRNLPRIRRPTRPPYIFMAVVSFSSALFPLHPISLCPVYRNILMDGSKRGYANLCSRRLSSSRNLRGYRDPIPSFGPVRDGRRESQNPWPLRRIEPTLCSVDFNQPFQVVGYNKIYNVLA